VTQSFFISTHVQLGGAETQFGMEVQVLISMCSLGEPTCSEVI
jgi:hypothetical protein